MEAGPLPARRARDLVAEGTTDPARRTARRRAGAALAALAALLAFDEALLRLAALPRPALRFDVGPSTGSYLQGFTESEERGPLTFRWTRRVATIRVPLESPGGPATLRLRAARFLDQPVEVGVSQAGRPLGRFSIPPGRFRVVELPIEAPAGAFELRLDAPEAPGEDLGVALDWLEVEGLRWRVPTRVPWPGLLVAGVFGLALFLGYRLGVASGAAALAALLVAGFAASDPFGLVHVSQRLTLPALGLAFAAAAPLRRRAGGRLLVLIFLAGYLVKGAGLFHPSCFYPDMRLFGRYTRALGNAEGGLASRGRAAQIATNTAYPRFVGGKPYAFPYSPLFFVPFTWLPPERALVEDALKHVALAAAAAEVLGVFWLAALTLGEGCARRAALQAALLAAFLPPLYNRLLLAMYATIAGHLLDLLAIVLALRWLARPESRSRFLGFGGALLASLLSYVSSLFNMGGFAAALALFDRRRARRVLALLAATTTLTVLWLYLPFTISFLTEILPSLRAGAGAASGEALPGQGLAHALGRIPLFYGWAYPALTLAGLALIARRAAGPARRVVFAYASTFVLLVALRAFGGGLFKDLKEIEFVGPLVALCSGAALDALARHERPGRLAAGVASLCLVAFGLWHHVADFAAHSRLLQLD